MTEEIRPKLISACSNHVEERIGRIRAAIDDLQDALKLETKCSMGDKYETSRAMLHLEFEKLAAQLEQLQRLKKTLTFISEKVPSKEVTFGSVVLTSKVNYFLAIPAGEIKLEESKFFAVGANSPIAKAMIGRKEGEAFIFNGTENKITEVG